MKFDLSKFSIPSNLKKILKEDEYWEDDSLEPIIITIEEIMYKGKAVTSYQVAFETLDDWEEFDGDLLEALIKLFIEEKNFALSKNIKGDSDSATCVLWTDNETHFISMLKLIIELLENEQEIERIKEKHNLL